MKQFLALLLFSYSFINFTYAQSSNIEVADISVKVPGLKDKEYYYSFETGDEIIFNFSDLSKKGLKQIEIIEYPGNVKFAGIQVTNVTKNIKVNKRSIYLFRFTNNALVQRVCNVRISRKPADINSIDFDTNVTWKEVADTTYTTISKQEITRYDTTFSYIIKKELVSVDTVAEELINRNEQIAALTTIGKPSESLIHVSLPINKATSLETTELISWAYWIGVGQEGHLAFEANKKKYLQALGSLANMTTSNPLIGFALNQVALLPTGNVGSNVAYYFMRDYANAEIFLNNYDKGGFRYFDTGNGVSGYGKKEAPLQGAFYIGLHNDNFYYDINVTFKLVVVTVKKRYVEKQYKQPQVIPHYENRIVKQPVIKIKKVPFTI